MDLNEIAASLAEKVQQEGVSVSDLEAMVPSRSNLYPSNRPGECADTVYVISLTKPRGQGRGHLSLSAAITVLLDHAGHTCLRETRKAVLIVDCWDPRMIEPRLAALRSLGGRIDLSVILLGGGWFLRIPV